MSPLDDNHRARIEASLPPGVKMTPTRPTRTIRRLELANAGLQRRLDDAECEVDE
jgi:hypothetical protein